MLKTPELNCYSEKGRLTLENHGLLQTFEAVKYRRIQPKITNKGGFSIAHPVVEKLAHDLLNQSSSKVQPKRYKNLGGAGFDIHHALGKLPSTEKKVCFFIGIITLAH